MMLAATLYQQHGEKNIQFYPLLEETELQIKMVAQARNNTLDWIRKRKKLYERMAEPPC